ncbi:hypothetical protein GCM10010495_73060 [Kitasatospora herbaricolor]|uniref:hypothetical protein n=1 Tax=Kitasatospora herbaricolor TaxID=68217 RepID=UPI0019C334E4|nr:hypothetical protein [Kitasatospora herbaricolor]MDQ0306793.1 hypothetical protein [Kitasatospora herbaricolor]GGV44941.1 hypothetical protein GCM10010495_73060 [Kitasatospora herbaricolor]
MVHVGERIDGELHDLFVVFRVTLVSGTPSAPHFDEDVSEVAWVPVARAGELMPWYAGGVQALLAAGGAGYGTTRR